MADLLEYRGQLDEIDAQIVALYEKRMDVCKEIAQYKISTGKKVFDRQREREKLVKVKSLTHDEFYGHGVEELFEQIMSVSRKLQYRMLTESGVQGRLPFIGVALSFHDKADNILDNSRQGKKPDQGKYAH